MVEDSEGLNVFVKPSIPAVKDPGGSVVMTPADIRSLFCAFSMTAGSAASTSSLFSLVSRSLALCSR